MLGLGALMQVNGAARGYSPLVDCNHRMLAVPRVAVPLPIAIGLAVDVAVYSRQASQRFCTKRDSCVAAPPIKQSRLQLLIDDLQTGLRIYSRIQLPTVQAKRTNLLPFVKWCCMRVRLHDVVVSLTF
jgi:hypothetical protein